MPVRDTQRLNLLETLLLAQAGARTLATLGRGGAAAALHFEDAAAAGAVLALAADDRLLCDARHAAALLARGAAPATLLAQALGRATAGGRAAAGTLLADGDREAVALAPAMAVSAPSSVPAPALMVVFDEGEIDALLVESSMRFAAVGRAPVLFVCRSLPWHLGVARAAARLGLECTTVPADDAEALQDAAAASLQAMRADRRPRLLLRACGLPIAGAAGADAFDEADADVLGQHPRQDPAALMVSRLLDEGFVGPGELVRLYQEADATAREAALRACKTAPAPVAAAELAAA